MAKTKTLLALTNAELETVTRGRIARGMLLVREGRIAALGRNLAVPNNARTMDLQGRLVTPGLIEAHSHAGLMEDGLPGDEDVNELTDPVTPQLFALDAFKPSDVAICEAAEGGVTTMYITAGSANLFGGVGAIVKTWGARFDDYILRPAAGMKMALGENPKRCYGGKGKEPGTRMGIAALIRKTFNDARNYLEKKRAHERKQRGKKTPEPFARDLKLEAVARVLSGELPVRCHAHRACDMLTFIRIAEEYKLRYVFEHATEAGEILEELKARNVPVIIGPTLGPRGKIETRRKTFATVAQAFAAGLLVAITSDHWVTPLKNLPVYAALAVREGLSNADALRAMTINPAKILGLDGRLGSLEAGKDADLVIWDGDPLDARHKPARVMIGGKFIDQVPRWGEEQED